jgi:hypothetical protein
MQIENKINRIHSKLELIQSGIKEMPILSQDKHNMNNLIMEILEDELPQVNSQDSSSSCEWLIHIDAELELLGMSVSQARDGKRDGAALTEVINEIKGEVTALTYEFQ